MWVPSAALDGATAGTGYAADDLIARVSSSIEIQDSKRPRSSGRSRALAVQRTLR